MHFGVKEAEKNRAKCPLNCCSVSFCLSLDWLCLFKGWFVSGQFSSALPDTCYPSSVSQDFSSEHGLSCYLIKHPRERDALEVIGFGTRGKGHRVEFVCVCLCACAQELAQEEDVCACLCCGFMCVSVIGRCWCRQACVLRVCGESLCFQEVVWMSKTKREGSLGGLFKNLSMWHMKFVLLKDIYVILTNFCFYPLLTFITRCLCC